MSDSSSWSLHLGRWRGVHIRVHAVFLVVAIFALFLSTSQIGQEASGYGILCVAVLFASVLAHEWGHHFAARRLGGGSDQMVIGPLGGLLPVDVPREPHSELIVALAGPLVNLGLLLVVLPMLVAAHLGVTPLLSPLEPTGLIDGAWWEVLLKLTFWTNWVLLVINLLPAFPLDGARILRTMLWPAFEYRQAATVAIRATKLTAIGACVLAWIQSNPQPGAIVPTWVSLLLFAAFLYFGGQQESARMRRDEDEWDEDLFSYDFSQGYTSLERTIEPSRRPPGTSVRRWLENRRAMRRRRRESQEQEEERQVDEILIRLHQSGMAGLTDQERAILHRVSARYRNRQQN